MNAEASEPTQSPTSKWITIVISAALGIVTSVTATVIVSKLQAHAPKLLYSTSDTLPFAGQDKAIGIYQVSISNEGQQEIEEVVCLVRIPNATVENTKVSAPGALEIKTKTDGDAIRLSIPSLNPAEVVRVSALATASSGLPSRPDISLRAKGVTGVEKTATGPVDQSRILASFSSATLSIATMAVYLMFLTRFTSQKGEMISLLCRSQGLEGLAVELNKKFVTYVGAADRITEVALQRSSARELEQFRTVFLALSGVKGMADESRAGVLFDLARLAAFSNDESSKEQYLTEAPRYSRREVTKRESRHKL